MPSDPTSTEGANPHDQSFDDRARPRLSIFCDADGCWLPAVKLYRGDRRVVCRGHALGVLD